MFLMTDTSWMKCGKPISEQHFFDCLPGIGLLKEIQAEERGDFVLNLQHNRNLKGSSSDRDIVDNPDEHNVLL